MPLSGGNISIDTVQLSDNIDSSLQPEPLVMNENPVQLDINEITNVTLSSDTPVNEEHAWM